MLFTLNFYNSLIAEFVLATMLDPAASSMRYPFVLGPAARSHTTHTHRKRERERETLCMYGECVCVERVCVLFGVRERLLTGAVAVAAAERRPLRPNLPRLPPPHVPPRPFRLSFDHNLFSLVSCILFSLHLLLIIL
jgi:hypothetical protein